MNPDFAKRRDAVLRRFRFEFIGRLDVRHERDVDVEHVAAILFAAKLSNGLQKRKGFDVAHRAAHFDNRDVAVVRTLAKDELNLVRDVRNDLNRAAQIVAVALLRDDAIIDPSRRAVVRLSRLRVRKSLVMTEVHVRFGAVFCDVDFAVLERVHRARIDVDVRIQFHKIHPQTA